MFVLSWIRSSDAQASYASKAQGIAASNAGETYSFEADSSENSRPDDWVFLPSDHADLMESSISDLDLLSASMTLYPSRTSTASSHPASSPSRIEEILGSNTSLSGAGAGTSDSNPVVKKSKRQLKQEKRDQRAREELERKPRFDPTIAKQRDQELKMAKMAKLGLRNGQVMSGTPGIGK